MAKIKNKRFYSSDREYLQWLADELEWIGGRPFKLDLKEGVLIQYALPPHKPSKKKEKPEREPRNKHAESVARKN